MTNLTPRQRNTFTVLIGLTIFAFVIAYFYFPTSSEIERIGGCCCSHQIGDISQEGYRSKRFCNAAVGQCIQVSPNRLTPHSCCPFSLGERCGR